MDEQTVDEQTVGGTRTIADDRAVELCEQLSEIYRELGQIDPTALSTSGLVEVGRAVEVVANQGGKVGLNLLAEVDVRDVRKQYGHRNLTMFLAQELRITNPTARVRQMRALTTHTTPWGEQLNPACPTLAKAATRGAVAPGHVAVVLDVLDKIPSTVTHDAKVAAEKAMAEYACQHTPRELTQIGARLLAYLDPDGSLTDGKDRARHRNLWLNRQDVQLMSKLTGHLDPETRAMLETVLAAWAAPGMNNPDDPDSVSGIEADADPELVKAAAARDGRSVAQRNHDALRALLKAVLDDGVLGKSHRGLPPQLIIKVTLADLQAEAGLGTTASGSLMPITDVIKTAAQSDPWLAVFDETTPQPLFFGRGKRFATRPQRLALFAMEGGHVCSAPGCDQPATHLEIHHVHEWQHGGLTDLDNLTGTCGVHNRMVGDKPGQWTTEVIVEPNHRHHRRIGWSLNRANGTTGPPRVNSMSEVERVFSRCLHEAREEIYESE